MRINTKKTKMMLFNQSRSVDFQPDISIEEDAIELMEETKLLGVVITSDLKWRKNTEYLSARGYSRLWMIKRLKKLNCPIEELLDTYIKQVRSIMEMACPVWHPALTQADSRALERVQKSALAIILGRDYTTYSSALNTMELETLEERRSSLCLKFSLKSASHPEHNK